MKAIDFEPYYGVHVLLQLKEPIAFAQIDGAMQKVPCFNEKGKPIDAEGNETEDPTRFVPQATWPIRALNDPEGKAIFRYLINDAVILPRPDGSGRLVITYRERGSFIELLIEPEFILACSTIRAVEETESRLIAKA